MTRWVLIFWLFSSDLSMHAAVQRFEEEHLSFEGCDWARQELKLAKPYVAKAWCRPARRVAGKVPAAPEARRRFVPIAEVAR